MGIKVLSLFDGISCGMVALERAGIDVEKYYASEIDESAIIISKKNYPEIIQLGNVTEIKGSDLSEIDMLIGGSPCQGFSLAGKQLNFNDERSKLFFEYVRILKEINPKYFLLENVKMKKEYQDIISEYLGVEPIEINSSLVSAQNRKRLYWTNIPNVKQPEDKKIYFRNVIKKERKDLRRVGDWVFNTFGEKSAILKINTLYKLSADKSHTLTTSKTHSMNYYLSDDSTMYSNLDSEEAEILQTIPIGYTSGVVEGKRFKMLGNGWTVDVIAHIFKGLK